MTEIIKITSCYLEHTNHKIHLDKITFASVYQQFPEEVKKEIEYYTSKRLISQIAAFYILMISRYWYKDEHYSKLDKLLRSQLSITYQNGSTILTSNFISDSTFIYPSSGISINISKILNTYRAYRITNSRCKKAMAVGLVTSVIAIETLNKEIQNDESSEDNQENIAPFDISTVQNPITKKKKGAPRVKHIKSSLELKTTQSITKKDKGICFVLIKAT
ncbi:16903_t:CDS:2 [Racocetra persica]|uniref:16903_t:CDS:1 n=1 Tax=Racocetra persica TaxID=160502 RepID=A0ACA9KWA8_9GLOM|nr:16903_t:CDS:2 [Racocetra persica]